MYELENMNVVRIVATEGERDKLLAQGFKLRESEPTKQETGKSVDDMTVSELKEYAEKHSIDLKGATKKDDILAVIKGGGAGGN